MISQDKSLFLLLMTVILLSGCARVEFDPGIDNYNENLPVVDAVLGNHSDYKTITISRTAPYMNGSEVEKIDNATVTVSDQDQTYVFEYAEDGKYQAPSDFNPAINTTYSLNIEINGETYEAESTMRQPVNMKSLQIQDDPWEKDDNFYEVTSWIKDNEIEGEKFVFKYAVNGFLHDSISAWSQYSDKLTNNTWLEDATILDGIEAVPGDQINIFGLSISDEYYDFIEAAEKNRNGYSPFNSPGGIPIPGNISNGALGIFQVSAIVKETATVPDKEE
jgi:hypothetical protein